VATDNTDNVLNIGDLSVWRKRGASSHYPAIGECKHLNLTYDDHGEIITCKDCKKQLGAFWAFKHLSNNYGAYMQSLKNRAEQVRIREEKGLILKAAQEIERAWRSRTMVPACPHCKKAIMPTDKFGGLKYSKADPEGAEKSFKSTMVYLPR
jgi:hypothetical protein